MRCARARQWMAAAADGELVERRQRALDRHVERCPACREEMAGTARVLAALDALPFAAEIPARLEQATLRRVRLEAAEEGERSRSAWWPRWVGLSATAVAAAAVLVLTFGVFREEFNAPGPARGPAPGAERLANAPGEVPARAKTATADARRTSAPAAREQTPAAPPPAEPPPALAAAPDLFIELPILRNMEKLEHFDTITSVGTDTNGDPDGEGRSNG